MGTRARRARKKYTPWLHLRETRPDQYRELIQAEKVQILRTAWQGTEYSIDHKKMDWSKDPRAMKQPMAIELVRRKIAHIPEPIRSDIIEEFDKSLQIEIIGTVSKSVAANLATWPAEARR